MTLEAQPSRFKCLLWLLGGCVGAFLIVAPYTVLDLPGFLNGFAALDVLPAAPGVRTGLADLPQAPAH